MMDGLHELGRLRSPLYSIPHFSFTMAGLPVSSCRKGLGLTGTFWQYHARDRSAQRGIFKCPRQGWQFVYNEATGRGSCTDGWGQGEMISAASE
jgi:hypothetical protein